MICPNCKETIEDSSKFCEHCGAKIETPVPQETVTESKEEAASQDGWTQTGSETTQQPAQEASRETVQSPAEAVQPPAPKKPLNKKLVAAIAAAACVLILVIVLVATHKEKINLQDYARVEFSGYEKYGKATLDFDYTKLVEDFGDKSNLKTDVSDVSGLEDLADGTSDSAKLIKLFDKLSYKLDKDSDLKNGDKVTVKFTFDNELAKEFGVKFEGEDLECKVSGLEKVREVNPFDDVTVEFSGTSPNASVSVKNESKDEAVSGLYFETEPSGDLAVGDKVTVSVEYDEESFMQQYGCKLTETEKEFTCENVDAYVTAAADISEDLLKQMQGQTEDVVKAYFAGEKDELKMSGLKYEGYYFLNKKDPDSWSNNNQIYIVYSANVKSKNKSFKASKVYFPVKFTNIIKYADGTLYVDLNSTSIEGRTDLSFGWWGAVSGYTDLTAMKNELVTAQKSTYQEEVGGTLQ